MPGSAGNGVGDRDLHGIEAVITEFAAETGDCGHGSRAGFGKIKDPHFLHLFGKFGDEVRDLFFRRP